MEKKFKDLQKGDPIFILEPFTNNIHQTEVAASSMHPKSERVWVIDFYILLKFGISPERLKAAVKNSPEADLKVTQQAFLYKEDSITVLLVKPAPTILATSKHQIERWLATMTPNDLAMYLGVKNRKR